MKILYFIISLFLFHCVLANYDDEFAEFEEDYEESETPFLDDGPTMDKELPTKDYEPLAKGPEEAISDEDSEEEAVVEDDTEFEHFQDADEFEGFDEKEGKPASEPKITIAKNIPVTIMMNWDSYYLEIVMSAGLVAYFLNFLMGKAKNFKIANSWYQVHKQLLEENFALVGDDGSKERRDDVSLVKESENVYTLWCSGRTCCEGMLVELRLIKRHDLVGLIANIIKPLVDQVQITVRMNKEDMDCFIFAVASKKTANVMSKDLQDISIYCPDKKAGDKFGIPANFLVMSEMGEVSSAMLDSKIIAILNKYGEYIDYIHFSDQFSGQKPTDDTNSNAVTKLPEVDKVLRFGFNLPTKGTSLEETIINMKPLMIMVFYCIDKIKRSRLSKEGKAKAEKNRQKVEEAFIKSTHQARAEAAAARKEEKRRQEKERVMAEEDPEKQRRWEIREEKRQAKKRAPRMKQLKVKAL
ncbi:hypothetical protein ABEB36_008784 [Hypothenemus hampei]|uniref:PAT complex subunit CCDC47 n=1 Tax=Hypothenemus hampei TaxID=57062 RepID=A0ABD1ES33_HYPHA